MRNNGQIHKQQQGDIGAVRSELAALSAYQPGDVIGGRYRVHRLLGRGGFGVVYLVTAIETGTVLALKTFLDEFIFEEGAKRLFEREATVWVRLGWNPFIVQAHHVSVADDRMFVAIDYIPVDEDGLLSLHDHIKHFGRKITNQQIGIWMFQFCEGMEYAHSRGVVAHRDIKPMNLLVSDIFLKISDFGLASALDVSSRLRSPDANRTRVSIKRMDGTQICGTPGYMAPEILRSEGSGVHSDIFSFGVTLWQLAAGTTQLPYSAKYQGDQDRFSRDVYEQQMRAQIPRLDSPYWSVIRRCLDPDPRARFSSFEELRAGAKVPMKAAGVPVIDLMVNRNHSSVSTLVNQGAALRTLGLVDEAMNCYDKALTIEPTNAAAMMNKANLLSNLHKFEAAMSLYDSAIKIDPTLDAAWLNRALCLQGDGQHERAIRSFDKSLRINAKGARALSGKGRSFLALERYSEAIQCFKSVVDVSSDSPNAWTSLGDAYAYAGRNKEALECFEKATVVGPTFRDGWILKARMLAHIGKDKEALACLASLAEVYATDPAALNEIGIALCRIDHHADAINFFDRALELRPEEAAVMLCNKGNALLDLNREEEALKAYASSLVSDPHYLSAHIQAAKAKHRVGDLAGAAESYRRALQIDSRNEDAWFGRGSELLELKNCDEAIKCFDSALAINPRNKLVVYNKGAALFCLERLAEASQCLALAVRLDARYANAWYLKAYVDKLLGNKRAAMDACGVFLDLVGDGNGQQKANVENWVHELRQAAG